MNLASDLRSLARGLRKSPGFVVASVATLALASGVSIASLLVVQSILLRPLPVVDQDRIVLAWKEDRAAGFAHWPFSRGAYEAIRPALTTAAAVSAIDYNGLWPLTADLGDRMIKVPAGVVAGGFFRLLGVRPVAGRLLEPADDVRGAARVIVISEGFWRDHYGRRLDAIGQELRIWGSGFQIVGVVPDDFSYPSGARIWVPLLTLRPDLLDRPTDVINFDVVARLKPGVTPAQFATELETVRRRIPAETAYARQHVVVHRFPDLVLGDARPTLVLLAAGALLVLMVASSNIATLVLVRTGGRLRELAIRAALGAGRARVLRAVLLEHLVLTGVGSAAGLMVGWGLLRLLVPIMPGDIPRTASLAFHWGPALAAGGLTLLVAGAAGLVPVLAIRRADLFAALRAGGRADVGGWGTHPARRLLVGAQLALAVTVVSVAALLVQTTLRLQRIDLGFEPAELVLIEHGVKSLAAADTTVRRNTIDRVAERLGRVPGVAGVASALSPPFVADAGFYGKLTTAELSPSEVERAPFANLEVVTPSYFDVMGMRLIRGRPFTAGDREGSEPVVILNQALARILFGDRDPIGRRVRVLDTASVATVVGVVGDTRYNELERPVPSGYFSYRQIATLPYYTLVRLRPDASLAAMLPSLRAAVAEADPNGALAAATPIETIMRRPLARPRLSAALVALFGAMTLGLAAIGVYGVMAAFVAQRTREIGVRMALGAGSASVRRLVLRQGLTITAAGLGVGLAGAVAVDFSISRLLYGVRPTDPVSLIVVIAVLVVAALFAILIPAARATRVDPMVSLRAE